MTLIASSFLAGSLLTLLIPVALLIALVVWYLKFIARVPETSEGDKAGVGPAANPAPTAKTVPGAEAEARPREG